MLGRCWNSNIVKIDNDGGGNSSKDYCNVCSANKPYPFYCQVWTTFCMFSQDVIVIPANRFATSRSLSNDILTTGSPTGRLVL